MAREASLYIGVIGLLLAACRGVESPGDKREWSILQTVEFSTRSERINRIQFRTAYNYELMGVPRSSDGCVIWVMLKPEYGALYKQMPEGNFWISRDVYDKLNARSAMSDTVEQALRSHLESAKQP